MGFIHFAGCPVWGNEKWPYWACDCPRAWRIRKDRTACTKHHTEYPWVVLRRDSDGAYTEMMRARTWHKAISLVQALERAATKLRVNPDRSIEGCTRLW